MNQIWQERELMPRSECPLCKSPVDGKVLGRRSDLLAIKQCPVCSLLLVDPVPTEEALKRCYGEGYFNGRNGGHGIGSSTRNYFDDGAEVAAREHAEVTGRLALRGKSVLEVGCATGALLHCLGTDGPARRVGIDISDAAVAYGKGHYQLDLRCTTLEEAGFSDSEFDTILMFDVIEHVPRPRQFLDEVLRCLKEGGEIFLRTPNADSYQVSGHRWNYLSEGLEHVQYLSRATLDWLVGRDKVNLLDFWTEGCPGLLPSNHYHSSRLVRLAQEPRVILTNALRRGMLRGLPKKGMGLDFFAILQKPI